MLHEEIQKGADKTFLFNRFDESGQVIPSAGTYDIKDNSGTSVQSGALTIGTDGEMSFVFLTANNGAVGLNFKIELTYDTIKEYILFDVVETPLINITTDTDLFSKIPVLRDKIFGKRGQCSANGTTTTIIDTSLRADSRDWTGARGRIVQDDVSIDFRVSLWDRATSTITFSPAITSTVSGEYYNLRQSFEDIIEQSFSDVRQIIRNKIGLSSGYIDSNSIKNLVVYNALITICRSNVEIEGDKWSLWVIDFKNEFKDELTRLQEAYDTDGDGNISDEENSEKPNTIIMGIRR